MVEAVADDGPRNRVANEVPANSDFPEGQRQSAIFENFGSRSRSQRVRTSDLGAREGKRFLTLAPGRGKDGDKKGDNSFFTGPRENPQGDTYPLPEGQKVKDSLDGGTLPTRKGTKRQLSRCRVV